MNVERGKAATNAKALPTVEKLASGAAKTMAEARIRQAAEERLPFLQERARSQSAEETLLRPAPEAAAHALLRPVAHAPASDASLLLRPYPGKPSENSSE